MISGIDNLLEIVEVAPFTFLFKPILKSTAPALQIGALQLHHLEMQEMEGIAEIHQIRESLAAVEYDVAFNQADYNGLISTGLIDRGWQREQRVVPELGLKCDFEKNGVWVEVEFGNARSYYQDYVKFMLARKYR